MRSRSLGLVVLLVGSGCASLEGRFVADGEPTSEDQAVGVSYLLTQPRFELQRKTLAAGKKATPVHEIVVAAEPDPSRRFEVGLSPGLFSSDSFEVVLAKNGTVTSLTSDSADVTAKVVAGLAEFAVGIVTLGAVPGPSGVGTGAPPPPHPLESARDAGVIGGAESAEALRITPKLANGTATDAEKNAYKIVVTKVIKHLEDPEAKGSPHYPNVRERLDELDAATGGGLRDPVDDATEVDAVLAAMRDLEAFEQSIAKLEPKPPPPVVKLMSDLKQALDVALAGRVAKRPGADAAFDKALAAYRRAVDLVLQADDALSKRALRTRRTELVRFLSKPIPDAAVLSEETAYAQFAAELNAVSSAIASVLGTSGSKPPEALPLATEVTSRIDEKVFVDRFLVPITPKALLDRHVSVARARVRVHQADAALVIHPKRN